MVKKPESPFTPVLDFEFVKPAGVEGDRRFPDFERVADDRPERDRSSSERTNAIPRTAVTGQLLVDVSPHTGLEFLNSFGLQLEVLDNGRLDMKLGTGLVIRDPIVGVEGHPHCARKLGANFRIEIRIGCLQIHARPAQSDESDSIGIIDTGRNDPGRRQAPVVVSLGPAQQGGHRAIACAGGGLGNAELSVHAQRTGECRVDGNVRLAEGSRQRESKRSTEDLCLRDPAQRRDIDGELLVNADGEVAAEREGEIAAGASLVKIKAIGEIDTWCKGWTIDKLPARQSPPSSSCDVARDVPVTTPTRRPRYSPSSR